MIPPTSIDGTDITGATIDGTDVQEITVDGDVVFSASQIPASVDNHYPITANDNGTVLDDIGNINLDNNSATLVTDSSAREQRYYDVDGSANLATSNVSGLKGVNQMSVSLWVNIPTAPTGAASIVAGVSDANGSFSSGDYSWSLRHLGGTNTFQFLVGDAAGPNINESNIVGQGWTHVGLRYANGGDFDLTLNGLQTTFVGAGNNQVLRNGGNRFHIGAAAGGSFGVDDMDVDDIMVNRNGVFSDSDLQSIYNDHPRA